jgi:glycosyltransferase involved in cell wall biosynthesis
MGMRIGANPAKAGLPAYQPQRLGIATIVYVPSQEGYFENSLQILKYTLEGIRAATPQPFDLLVFDNGSCAEVVAELEAFHASRTIDWLVLSRHNLGKAGAWNWIFAAMPNELITYADSDVLFRPGWLEASLEILAAFPQAGMVSAQPNFYDVMDGQGQAHLALERDKNYRIGEYRPRAEIVDEFCLGIGATAEVAAPFYEKSLPAVTQVGRDVRAVIGASHMQFTIPRQVARQVVPLPATMGLRRAETMSLDHKIDALGYLHLSTLEPYVFHMGNTLSQRLLEEVRRVIGEVPPGVSGADKPVVQGSAWRRLVTRLVRHPRLNRQFVRLYNFLFQTLHSTSSPPSSTSEGREG